METDAETESGLNGVPSGFAKIKSRSALPRRAESFLDDSVTRVSWD
jgi:hypothetical protein